MRQDVTILKFMPVRIVVFLAVLFIGNLLSSQTIYCSLSSTVVPAGNKYTNGLWYTVEYGGSFCWVANKAEGEKFGPPPCLHIHTEFNRSSFSFFVFKPITSRIVCLFKPIIYGSILRH